MTNVVCEFCSIEVCVLASVYVCVCVLARAACGESIPMQLVHHLPLSGIQNCWLREFFAKFGVVIIIPYEMCVCVHRC